MHITFAGCGFLGIYHVGVASCFAVHAPNLIQKAGGASAGALAACCMLCGVDLGKCTEDVLDTATDARSRTLGPLSPRFDINQVLMTGLKKTLPSDAHKIVSGKLFVSLTRFSDRRNVVVSEFTSKEDLIQALVCSAFVPFWSGIVPPIFRGTRYIDGGISDNLPKVCMQTITVSPFSGNSDICPHSEDMSTYLNMTISNTHVQLTATNLYRLSRALFPPAPEVLYQMCKQGYSDALDYLKKNNLVACERHRKLSRSMSQPCLSVPALNPRLTRKTSEVIGPRTLEEEEEVSCEQEVEVSLEEDEISREEVEEMKEMWQEWESDDFFEEEPCLDCQQGCSNTALDTTLPTEVVDALQASCRKVNSGLSNILFNSRLGRVLSLASVPYVLPFDTAYTLTRRFVKWLPYLPTDFQWFLSGLIKAVDHIISQLDDHKAFRARFSCHLDLTEDFVSDFAKHWFRVMKGGTAIDQTRGASCSTESLEALDIVGNPSVRHNLNFEFSMDFEAGGVPSLSETLPEPCCSRRGSGGSILPSAEDPLGQHGEWRGGGQQLRKQATLEEENFDPQESFDYTIKVAQDMEEALCFHYLQVSQAVNFDEGQSSVEIHEI